MATVFDFAAQIQARLGRVDTFRLNKLVYYVQTWSLAWRGRPAFPERIEAWRHGPVAKDLWVDITHHTSTLLKSASPLHTDDQRPGMRSEDVDLVVDVDPNLDLLTAT